MAIGDKAAGAVVPDDSEWNPEWIRPWPEWRQALLEYRAMRAAMTPEEERVFLDKANADARREFAVAKRRAAARKRAEAPAGAVPAYPVYAGGGD